MSPNPKHGTHYEAWLISNDGANSPGYWTDRIQMQLVLAELSIH